MIKAVHQNVCRITTLTALGLTLYKRTCFAFFYVQINAQYQLIKTQQPFQELFSDDIKNVFTIAVVGPMKMLHIGDFKACFSCKECHNYSV